MSESIRIKPHHFIDIVRDFGDADHSFGPHPYGHHVHVIAEKVASDLDVTLILDFGADDICAPCIHNVGGCCDDVIDTSWRPDAPEQKIEWNLTIDGRWCEHLGMVEGDSLTAREFCGRLRGALDDLTGVYAEEPDSRSAARAEKIRRGIARLMGP